MLSKILSQQVNIQAFSTKLVKLKVNDKEIEVSKDTKLYDAIQMAGFDVPKMCYHPDLPTSGGICRICVVEDKKKPGQPIISCKQSVSEGMDIDTRTEKMMEFRRTNTALMFQYHPSACISCSNATKCEARSVCGALDIHNSPLKPVISKCNSKPEVEHVGKSATMGNDFSSNIIKIKDLCINCDRCIQACEYLEGIGVYGWVNDKVSGHSVGAFGPSAQNECIECGQCINRCPVGALVEKSEIEQVMLAIKDPKKKIVFQTAPAIRVAIAEEFGYQPGEKILKNELVEGLKMLGSNVFVVDTDFSADLTIIEEGYELLGRLKQALTGEKKSATQKESALPLVTSCSPGWIKFMEKNYPDFKHKISTCKSPQQMMGAVIKGYWSKMNKCDPKDIVCVSIMPCTAKKYEKSRPEMEVDGIRDVDNVLTTREVAKMLKLRGIDISKLDGVPYDGPLGVSTGAAVIFGATGGVMEAALRTAYEIVVGEEVPFPKLEIKPVRGMEGVKEAGILIPKTTKGFEFLQGATLKVAVAHGTINAAKLLDKLRECDKKGEAYPWHFIEIMGCPGGCIGGGGQPKPTSLDTRKERTKLIYSEDSNLPLRKSHENPQVTQIYKDWLEKPNSHVAHKYLHTHYYDKTIDYSKYVDMAKQKEIDSCLSKFEKNREDLVVEMLLSVTDKFGYVNDCAIVEIAKHAGIKPIAVLSAASAYMYFPLEEVGENVFYVCQCRNCKMKGSHELEKKMEKLLKCKMGENSADGKYSLRHANWLGWCVNDAPAMMLKIKGSDKIIPIMGTQTKKPKIANLLKSPAGLPPNNIKFIHSKNTASFFAPLDLKAAVDKAATMSADEVIKQLDISGLQGRGGAGFPTGSKWKSCKKEKNSEKYVVVNIDEGLPSTFKDWVLLIDDANRKKMIAGMCICAQTIGAKNAILYLRYEYRNLKEDLYKAIKEVQALNSEYAKVKFDIRLGGGPYVAGEGSALFESIEGKGARPRREKLRSTTSGVYNKPTVINNVETFIAVPIILNIGGAVWAQNKGANGEKGIKLYSLTGDLPVPLMIEQTLGTNLNALLKEGGVTGIEAAEIGGTTERIALKKEFDEPIGFKKATFNGVGSIVLLNKSRSLTEIYEDKMHFMMEESCQQCVPCRDGSKVLYEAIKGHNHGGKKLSEQMDYLEKIAESAEATSICSHGKAVGQLFKSVAAHLKKEEKAKK